MKISCEGHNVGQSVTLLSYIIIITIIIKHCTLWSVPSPHLQLLAPTLLRSSNCSPSLWSVAVWFQRDSVLWHSLQVLKTSSVCIRLSCPVCLLSAVRGVCSHLFCGHKGCSLPEVSVTSFLSLQFFVFLSAVRIKFSDPYKNIGKTKRLYIFKNSFRSHFPKNSSLNSKY